MTARRAPRLAAAALAAGLALAGCAAPTGQEPTMQPTGSGTGSPHSTPPTGHAVPPPGGSGTDGSRPVTPAPSGSGSIDATVPPPRGGAAPPSRPPAQTSAELLIEIAAEGRETTATHRLVCEAGAPVDGTGHPDPEAACGFLAGKGPRLLGPPPGGRMCTQQYGGPATARVTGTLNGARVDRSFSLRDGCEISDWKAAAPLLGPAPSGP